MWFESPPDRDQKKKKEKKNRKKPAYDLSNQSITYRTKANYEQQIVKTIVTKIV